MIIDFNRRLTVLLILSFFIISSNLSYGQGLLNKIKKKFEDKANNTTDDILNGKKKDTTTAPVKVNTAKDQVSDIIQNEAINSKERPKLSELHDEDFVQNSYVTAPSSSMTRYPIAKNLFVDLKGNYPNGYAPKWRFISYPSSMSVTVENWFYPNANVRHENYPFSIVAYNDKAVLRLHPFIGCECFADIVVKDSFAVINNSPQTFQITNFRKILNERSTGEPCTTMSGNYVYAGGLEGRLTLSANDNGDLLIDFMLENYSADHKDYKGRISKPSQVSLRYIAKGITVENEMSPEKAIGIIAAEKEAKQRQKDYEVKTKKQLDSVMKVIGRKYPQPECRDCFYSSSGGYISSTNVDEYYVYSGNYAGSHTEYDLNIKTIIRNKCNYDLTFVGIQQMHSDDQGYYLQEVTKTMPINYNYSSDQGIMASAFSSILGMGSEFNIKVQDKYYINYASVGAVQWLKVIKSK